MKRKRKRKRTRKRKRKRKRKRIRKKKKEEEEEKQEEGEEEEEEEEEEGEGEEEDNKCFSFFSWLQDELWKSLLQVWTLRTNLSKWTGPSHGPVPWKFVEKLLFNEGSISGLILFGKAWALNLAIAFVKGFSFFSKLQDQLWKSLINVNPENKTTKVNWALSWPTALEICGKAVL